MAFDYSKNSGCSDQLKLGLILNQSVFYYEVLNNPEQACKIIEDNQDILQAHRNQEKNSTATLIMENEKIWKAVMELKGKKSKEAGSKIVQNGGYKK